MKFKNIIYLAMLSIASIANAQNDTLYMYKDGKATLISSVSGIDSMVVKKTKAKLTIGQSYQGGLVAYILPSGNTGYDETVNKGFIIAPTDQSTSLPWSIGANTLVGNTSFGTGTGANNTTNIVTKLGKGNYAASLCNDLVLNGYNDWFLPSFNELNKLYLNKSSLNITGTTSQFYWSSSESDINEAFNFDIVNGVLHGNDKITLLKVRAVRNITPDTSSNISNTIYFFREGTVINSFETQNIDSLSFQKPVNQLYEGMYFQGGIIARIFQPTDSGYVSGETHGLIISPIYQSAGITWHNGVNISTNTVSRNGMINTERIIAIQGVGNYAASICYDLILNGYEDWYLPSDYELNLILNNMYKFSKYRFNIWSSTEFGFNMAWSSIQDYSSGEAKFKYELIPVRAIRRF
jgi:hypothetical protein